MNALSELTRQTAMKTLQDTLVRQQSIIRVLIAYIANPPEITGLRALKVLEELNVVPDGNDRKDKEAAKDTGKGTSS